MVYFVRSVTNEGRLAESEHRKSGVCVCMCLWGGGLSVLSWCMEAGISERMGLGVETGGVMGGHG